MNQRISLDGPEFEETTCSTNDRGCPRGCTCDGLQKISFGVSFLCNNIINTIQIVYTVH